MDQIIETSSWHRTVACTAALALSLVGCGGDDSPPASECEVWSAQTPAAPTLAEASESRTEVSFDAPAGLDADQATVVLTADGLPSESVVATGDTDLETFLIPSGDWVASVSYERDGCGETLDVDSSATSVVAPLTGWSWDPGSMDFLSGVHVLDGGRFWLTASYSQMVAFFDGERARVHPMPAGASAPEGIDGVADDDIWIATTGTHALHWDGSALTAVATGGSWTLRDVYAAAADDVYFTTTVGGTVLRYNGVDFDTIVIPSAMWAPTAITGHGSDAIWVATYGGAEGAQVWFFNGMGWAEQTLPPAAGEIHDLHAADADHVWAADAPFNTDLVFDSGVWSTFNNPAGDETHSIHALSASEVWTGNRWAGFAGYDGMMWSSDLSGALPRATPVVDIDSSPDGGWALAVAEWGGVFELGPSGWTLWAAPWLENGNFDREIEDVHGSGPDNVWAVTQRGIAYHWDGVSWSHEEMGTIFRPFGVAVESEDSVWAVGLGGGIGHYDGTGWSAETSPTMLGFFDVDVAPDGTVIAVGDDETIVRRDAMGMWQTMTTPTNSRLYSVHVLSATDAWAAGSAATLLHWDGTDWSAVTTGLSASWSIHDVHVSAEGSVWMALSNGYVARYNPTTMMIDTPPLTGLTTTVVDTANCIWPLADDDVWVARTDGELFHYDGATFEQVDVGAAGDLLGLYVASPSFAWVTGSLGEIRSGGL